MPTQPNRSRTTRRRLLALAGMTILPLATIAGPLLSATPVNPAGASRAAVPAALRALDGVAGPRATVLAFVGTECPISNAYAPTLAALDKRYRSRGVRFVLVHANRSESEKKAADHARRYGLAALPVRMDPEQRLADAVGARQTPEVFLLDSHRIVRYAGRIDDRYVARGQARARVAAPDLERAIDAVLAGKPVAHPRTVAVGCVIERSASAPVRAEKRLAAGPTYGRDVAPILQQNCQSCHRAGEIGPFALESYADAKRWARNLVDATQARRMPPWKPVAGHGDFQGVRRLSEAQIALLKRWADAGAPQGNAKDTPAPPKFAKGWTLGTPDLVLTMPEAWRTPAEGQDIYRCFVLPTGLTQDKEVVGVEIRAGNKRVVHHVLVYVDDQGRARAKDAGDAEPGYTSFSGPGFAATGEMGGWAPGNMPRFLPEGIGRPLPKGSDIILQVHYHPTGKPEEDRTTIGLHFARKPITRHLRVFPVVGKNLRIPAGESNFLVRGSVPVPFNAEAIAIMPHMHLLGKTMKMTLTLPDGTTKPLIAIDDWDFQWQDTYAYRTPVALPKGARIDLEATYDNSTSNPRNPNSPPRLVTWGEKTTDEMCIGFVNYITEDENNPIVKILDGVLGGGRRTAR